MTLCSHCSKLNLSRLRLRKRHPELDFDRDTGKWINSYTIDSLPGNEGAGDFSAFNEDVSTAGAGDILDSKATIIKELKQIQKRKASDILNLRQSCDLCCIFATSIEKNNVSKDSIIEISLGRFCSTIDDKSKDRETVRLQLIEMKEPSGIIFGPLEADQLADVVDSPCILEMQECCSPIPSTDDEDLDNSGLLPRELDRRFSGRLITPKVNPRLFRKWMNLCGKLHGESCGTSVFPEGFEQKLKSLLVIDVQEMCIVNAPENSRYVVLSYCWGNVPVLKHLKSNSTVLRQPTSLSTMDVPATIADAIMLVRDIGERYLWVDALCIIQDDPITQAEQLSQMGLVYALAAFTIVAASAGHANSGLPGVRANTRTINQEIIQLGNQVLLTVVDGLDYYDGIKKSDWATRAWTMQEKILSKKLLIFTEQQVYWSCWKAVWLEEVDLEEVLNINFHHNPVTLGPEDAGFSSITNPIDVWGLYRLLVNAYRHRRLTYNSDILNAFSGICQALGAIAKDTYHWGLPRSRFGLSLCWYLRSGGARNHALCYPPGGGTLSSTPSVPFPSWSWVAWHGTSKKSWIDWDATIDFTLDNAEITFFAYNFKGELEQITKNTENESHALRSWKRQPQRIDDVSYSGPTQLGYLYFWTSTAILPILRSHITTGYPRVRQVRHTIVDLDVSLHMDSWENTERVGNAETEDIEGQEVDEILNREFVVIAALRETLYVIVIEWEDGVAYRIGFVRIPESYWSALPNLIWKQLQNIDIKSLIFESRGEEVWNFYWSAREEIENTTLPE